MKGKPLLPTLRAKKRYLAYEIISGNQIPHEKISRAVFGSFRDLFGSFGLGKAGLRDLALTSGNRGIFQINHNYLNHLRASLLFVKSIDNIPVILHTVGVSGILHKAKEICV